MTFPHSPQFPKPGRPPGRLPPAPAPARPPRRPEPYAPSERRRRRRRAGRRRTVTETGHPAVDAVLRSLENASRLAPGDQIAEYEAAHQVLQETLASIDG